jgi:hypothetical protein
MWFKYFITTPHIIEEGGCRPHLHIFHAESGTYAPRKVLLDSVGAESMTSA